VSCFRRKRNASVWRPTPIEDDGDDARAGRGVAVERRGARVVVVFNVNVNVNVWWTKS
jgi:hypothetical protein